MEDVECPLSDPLGIIPRLSDIPAHVVGCKNIHIYLVSGTHTLDRNLDFSDLVEETQIHGASHGRLTSIECQNSAGIRFSENRNINKVQISNVRFLSCHRERNVTDFFTDSIQAALYLKHTVYTLRGVIVKNTDGWGLYADGCEKQTISNCTFSNNKGNILFMLREYLGGAPPAIVVLNNTEIRDSSGRGGVEIYSISYVLCVFNIANCSFQRNQRGHLIVQSNSDIAISITDSNFSMSGQFGVAIYSRSATLSLFLERSKLTNNEVSLLLYETNYAEILDCLFIDNEDNAVNIQSTLSDTEILISGVSFLNNSGAIYLYWNGNLVTDKQIRISECNFTNQIKEPIFMVSDGNAQNDHMILEKSSFHGNKGLMSDCSVLYVQDVANFTLSNVNITDNDCTGITISGSTVFIRNLVNFTRNHGLQGGGLRLINAEQPIIFTPSSKLIIVNNTARSYGGGILIGKDTCDQSAKCFFKFESDVSIDSKVIMLSGNSAKRGGDVVFGGCLSGCQTLMNEELTHISKCYRNNSFWNLVSSTNILSQSTFVELHRRAVFCTSSKLESDVPSTSCNDSLAISVYRGQIFTVPLMVADFCCFPSVERIEANVKQGSNEMSPLSFKQDAIQTARKYCHHFSYALKGGFGKTSATIEFSIEEQTLSKILPIPPVSLTVYLKDCPKGYESDLESGECSCNVLLSLHGIRCSPSNLSFLIPAQTWMGELEMSGSIAVQGDCQYCKNEETRLLATDIAADSHGLCVSDRGGVMCGDCVAKFSLQLGGYECADCSNFTYKGVLLSIAFTFIGITLVLLLLRLNLTVSTGMINGLIFYSNIVYLNSDTLLPITREGNSTHLQNAVRILSTFQAWINLDFGIVTCFFDGYDTYISTWMQFVFPLYIWLLILVIVLSSRYSSRISRITTSNTVSVLATLLLLSYAKILKTSIEAFSSVQLQLLDGNMTRDLWRPDSNIPYLGKLHLPLFLMSLVMVLFYVIPFTLLILLRPLLQGKSHYKVLHWINKLKPFLDAFYGPYTSRYRYWPGILLLARVVILGTFAFYSPNDIPFKLLTVSVMATVLLVSWMIIGKINRVSLNRTKHLNYLELFLLLNLSVFAALSIYAIKFSSSKIKNQQVLAVVMVGTVLLLFCGILGYHLYATISKHRAVRKLIEFIPVNIIKRKDTAGVPHDQCPIQTQEDISKTITHTLVDITGCATPNDQLREPLMTNDAQES